MNKFKKINPLYWLYGVLIAITICFLVIVIALSAAWDIFNLRENFVEHSDSYSAYVRDQLTKNETLLAGFGAFITGADTLKLEAAKAYADIMLARYPQVTMFQIAQSVSGSNSQIFSERLGQQLGNDPEIMDAEGNRSALSSYLARKHEAFPVIFIAPRASSSALGLDLRTIEVVKELLPQKNDSDQSILISEAFELLEGDSAVVMVHPIKREKDQYVVILVVKLKELLPPSLLADENTSFEFRLQNTSGVKKVLYSSFKNSNDTPILSYLLERSDHFEFAKYEVTLALQRAITKSDIHWKKIGIILLLMLALVGLIIVLQRLHLIMDKRLEEQRRRYFRAAHYDPLTGLSNRMAFELTAKKMVAQAKDDGDQLVVYFIDLNGFKLINDLQGHESGDAVLRKVGEILKQNLRQEDMAARFGGDEFVVLAKGVRDLNGLLNVLEKLRLSLHQPGVDGVDTSGLSASIGFSYTGIHGYDYDHLMRVADTSMYGEKHTHYSQNTLDGERVKHT